MLQFLSGSYFYGKNSNAMKYFPFLGSHELANLPNKHESFSLDFSRFGICECFLSLRSFAPETHDRIRVLKLKGVV